MIQAQELTCVFATASALSAISVYYIIFELEIVTPGLNTPHLLKAFTIPFFISALSRYLRLTDHL